MTVVLNSHRALKIMRRTGMIVSTGASAAALGWLGYVAVSCQRYGRQACNAKADTLLDRFMPRYEVADQHEIRVAAPASIT
jgi:hypothetical protein